MLRQWRAATPILKLFKLQIKGDVVPRIYVLHVHQCLPCFIKDLTPNMHSVLSIELSPEIVSRVVYY